MYSFMYTSRDEVMEVVGGNVVAICYKVLFFEDPAFSS
jgi:hypothetical protein